MHLLVPRVCFSQSNSDTTDTMRGFYVPALNGCLQLVKEPQNQRHQTQQSTGVPAHRSLKSRRMNQTSPVIKHDSHLWQSGCEMTVTIVSTAVSNSAELDSAEKQSCTSSWLSPNETSSPTQLDKQQRAFSFTLMDES